MPDRDLPSGPRPDALPADGEAARRADLLKAFLAQRQRMESLVSRWVGCRATAADLVQELFLRFWRRPAAPVEELGSYLLRSARNLAIDHLRGEGSRQRQLDDWLPEQRQGEPVGPEQALEAGDQWRRVEAALRGLPSAPGGFPAQSHPRPHLRGDRPGHAAFPKRRGKTYDARPRRLQGEPGRPGRRAGKERPAMTRPDSDAAPYEPVLEQTAQAWLVRLRGTPDAATRRAFEDWLAQRPAHAEAYARAEALWRLTEIPASRLAIEEADALEAYLRPRRASRNPRRWAYPLASVACLLAMLWLGGWWQPGDWLQDWRADYVAAPGQVAEWKLADGSYLSLDAGSAVRVRIDGGQRRVELLRGAAALRVKRDALPFVVEAGEGRARVLGTEFEVRRGAGATRVTVLQGRVAVSAGTGAGAAEEVLGAGQQVGFADGKLGRPVAIDAAAALAWRQGWLSFYRRPLAEVLDELARYYPGRILLLDDALGRQPVSGSFRSDDPEAALKSLQAVLGYRQQILFGRLVVIR